MKKQTRMIEKIIINNELNDRKSLDQVESLQELQQDQKEESSNQFIKEAFKASLQLSRNTYLNNATSGSDMFFKPGISLASIELMNKSNNTNGDENISSKQMIMDNAGHYQSSLN